MEPLMLKNNNNYFFIEVRGEYYCFPLNDSECIYKKNKFFFALREGNPEDLYIVYRNKEFEKKFLNNFVFYLQFFLNLNTRNFTLVERENYKKIIKTITNIKKQFKVFPFESVEVKR